MVPKLVLTLPPLISKMVCTDDQMTSVCLMARTASANMANCEVQKQVGELVVWAFSIQFEEVMEGIEELRMYNVH